MAKYDPNITVADANAAIARKQSIGLMRQVPVVVKVIADLKRQKVHVYNVGPWAQVLNTGSTGSFKVPACPLEKEYVEMLIMDGDPKSPTYGKMVPPISVIVDELAIQNEDAMFQLPSDDGLRFANEMLGIGPNKNPVYSCARFGMFATMNHPPLPEELEAARLALENYCRSLCKYAGDLYATDRKAFSKEIKPEVHFMAARILGRDNPSDSPWMTDARPSGRIKCKMCGRVVDPDVATCEGGHIVNHELYLQLKAAEEEILAATKARVK